METGENCQGLSVLFVSRDPLTVTFTGEELKRFLPGKAKINNFNDLSEAWSYVQKTDQAGPDAVIIDLDFRHGLSPAQLAANLKANNPETIVIALASHRPSDDFDGSFSAGGQIAELAEFIVKKTFPV